MGLARSLLLAPAFLATTGLLAAQVELVLGPDGDGMGIELNLPKGVAVDSSGNVFVASGDGIGQFFGQVFRVRPDGSVDVVIDSSGDGQGNLLSGPLGLAVDAQDNLFVGGSRSANLFRVTPGGAVTELIDATGDGQGNTFVGPEGLATDAAGNVYAAAGSSVFKWTPAGQVSVIIDFNGDGAGNLLTFPRDVVVEADGDVYVSDLVLDHVFRITPTGGISVILDAAGDGAGNVLDRPDGLAVDAQGNVYVAGNFSDNVFRVTPSGAISVVVDASGDGAGNALLGPEALALDADGNLFVACDVNSANVFQVTPLGEVRLVMDFTADGTQAYLSPGGLVVDGSGNAVVSAEIGEAVFRICAPQPGTETPRFATPPNPGTLARASGGPPTIGSSWMAGVSGVPSSLDVVFADPLGVPIEVPTSFGRLLCVPSLILSGPAGSPIPIDVPNDCTLVGRAVCVQGAGLEFSPLGVSFTNAIDVVLGTY